MGEKGVHFNTLIMLSACGVVIATPVQAAADPVPIRKNFHITASSLNNTLAHYVRDTDLQLVYDSGATRRVRSPGASGTMSNDEALRALLRGTGFTSLVAPSGVTAIVRQPKAIVAQGPLRAATYSSSEVQDGRAEPQEEEMTGLADIVVTAQRRQENLQEVPISISAIGAQTLDDAGVTSTDTLTQSVPSVQFTRSSASGLFFIRGVGTTNAASGDEGSNAFYLDNVYLPDLGQTVTSFNNIERVEVLKGPQGTLFGRNAFGGLIHVITREPGQETVVSAEASYGNYQTMEGRLYVATPLSSNVSIDLAVTGREQGNGWGRNIARNEEIRKLDYHGARSKLVFKPNGDLKITLAGDYYSYTDDTTTLVNDPIYPGIGPSGPAGSVGYFNSEGNDPTLTKLTNWGTSLTIDADLGFASLNTISALRRSKNHSLLDIDKGTAPLIALDLGTVTRSHQQEIRLISKDVDPFSWQIGAFYLRSRVSNDFSLLGAAVGGINSGSNVDSAMTTDSFAAFGEISYNLTPTTKLIGGLRWTMDKRKYAGTRFSVTNGANGSVLFTKQSSLSYDEFTYRLALRQEITDDISVYGSINRGFKAGTFTIASPEVDPVQPQFITAYELGLKTELFDRKLRLNVSAYHYDITDYQVRTASLALAQVVLLNAAAVKVDGIDIEFETNPLVGLKLFGGATLLNSRFAQFRPIPGVTPGAPFLYANPAVCDAPGTADPGTTTGPLKGGFLTCFGDASGRQTPIAPDFSASLGATYEMGVGHSGTVRLAALFSYNSGYPFEPDGLLRQSDYSVLNTSIQYKPTENWELELWGRNIAQTKYFVTRTGTSLGGSVTPSAPRTYGATLRYDF
jgi:iron complex outermembrane receptor protein